jgi:hypothetical protein
LRQGHVAHGRDVLSKKFATVASVPNSLEGV